MKIITSVLLIALTTFSFAQNKDEYFKTIPVLNSTTPTWARLMYSSNPNVIEVEKQYALYYKSNEFVKTTHTQNHKYWFNNISKLVDDNGYIITEDPFIQNSTSITRKKKRDQLLQTKTLGSNLGWVSMGPFETFKENTTQPISWHKNISSIDASLTNPNLVICGTEAGGVYKTIDKAQNWMLITGNEVFSGGNTAVKIHPTDENNYLVASNKRIYQTLDGGLSWIERSFINGTGNEFTYSATNHNLIFLSSTTGLYKSIDGGITWTQEFSDKCWDIDFHPTNSNIVYVLKNNPAAKRAEVFRSDDSGITWTLKDNGYYVPTDMANAIAGGGKIAVSPAGQDYVYVCLIGSSKAGDNGWIGIYKSTNQGDNWINPAGQDGGPYGPENGTAQWNVSAYSPTGVQQGFYNFDFEVSLQDVNKLWVATIRLSESTDGGASFTSIGGDASQRLSDIHADVQDIEVVGNDVWIASDGGVNYSNDQLMTHSARNRGIQAAHFWEFNVGWNQDTYTGGKYHDGTTGWVEGFSLGNAYNIGGVEEASGYIHPIEGKKMIFRRHYSSSDMRVKTMPDVLGNSTVETNAISFIPNEHYQPGESSGFIYDPRYADHIFAGKDNKVYKSTNAGASFSALFTFPNANGKVYEIEISRSNPDVMYCSYNPGGGYWDNNEIWKSIDGGNTWTITTLPSGNRRRFRISVDPEDENLVWIAVPRGDAGNLVFKTSDGGVTWINKTTALIDSEEIKDILIQGGTNDLVYLATKNTLFYWDTNTSDWIEYSTGLPLIAKALRIRPFYRDAELRFASAGRGVFARKMKDTLFTPIAQPMTYTDSVFCTRDSVQFDCHSMLKHQGASWAWTITPAPTYISSTTQRNPLVVFGNPGDYTVSLSITDANGNTNTKTINNMVNVSNGCEADSLAGNTLSLLNDGDAFLIQDINLTNVSNFTTTAWIKVDSLRAFQAVISNGKWCAHCNDNFGLTVDYYGSKLYYRWPGMTGSWSGASNLIIPTNEWVYVAMVVTPNLVTLYMNEQKWEQVQTTALNPTDLSSLFIGKGQYEKYFEGQIDEVSIWKRALSQNEIREQRHLTKKGLNATDPDFKSYYQFNSDNSTADAAGLSPGTLLNGANFVTSTAPVGPGTSERATINSNGLVSFPNEGIGIDFSTSNPQGEIVLTRLNVLPDSLPNTNPSVDNYWIVNNYGTNTTFGALDSISLKTVSTVSVGNPANAKLFIRSDNEHLNNWTELTGASNLDNGKFTYNNTANILNFSQFFIQSATADLISKTIVYTNVNEEICSNQTIMLGGANQNTAGVYYDTIAVSPTKDSVLVTTLIVNTVDNITINETTCDANNVGTVVQNLTNQAGCDSTVTTITTLLASDDITINETTCDANNVGTVVQNLINQAGCDSTVTTITTLDVINPTIIVNSTTLTANPNGLQYQWVNCDDNFSILNGETNRTFEATLNGSYAVMITNANNCTETSACTEIAGVGILENSFESSITIYPNPTSGLLTIKLDKDFSKIDVRVTNEIGQQIILNQVYNTGLININLEKFSHGVYFIYVSSKDEKAVLKVFKD